MTPRFALLTGIGLVLSVGTHAGVKSLSSDEMVDTYIKDSAIIVVPKKKESADDKKKTVTSITISPGKEAIDESDEQTVIDNSRAASDQQIANSLASAEEQFIKASLALPSEGSLAVAPPTVDVAPPSFGGQPIEIPEGPFAISDFNNQLGLAYDGNALTFSIGNPPGVSGIDIPYGINEGPVQLTPRPGGGFDLVIDVPKN